MKRHLLLRLFIVCTIIGQFHACKKEYSCEACNNNPPIANAGRDTTIFSPADSVILDASASTDPDGNISVFEWGRISGPDSILFKTRTGIKSKVSPLKKGHHVFFVTVTDNGGLSSRDTVIVEVRESLIGNRPPVASAGDDQVIKLPTNSVSLDGSASSDPDNNIISYSWKKISGPGSFGTSSPDLVKTTITHLAAGVYFFELLVTDAGSLQSRDTVTITVDENKPDAVTGHLQPEGKLSIRRHYPTAAAAGNIIVFAGGYGENGFSSRVDIFDTKTNSATTAELSMPRTYMAAVTAGDKIFFAGGITTGEIATGRIDIYDTRKNEWNTAELSVPRYFITAAAAGNKIVFAGGSTDPTAGGCSVIVDIYDLSTKSWTTAALSERAFGLTAVTVNNRIYFAGGECRRTKVDVYDADTNTWSTTMVAEPRQYPTSIAVDRKIYWVGGFNPDYTTSKKIEILDLTSNTISFKEMCSDIAGFKSRSFLHHNILLSFSGDGLNHVHFNKLDISTGQCTEGILDQKIIGAEIISVNNTVYVGGGTVNGVLSEQIWKLVY